MNKDILIAGVGGQGTILASRILADCAIIEGKYAKTAETIGMSQRGGCVVSHVRYESQGVGAVIPFKSADLIIGFEPCEAARNLNRLKDDGTVIVNTRQVTPITVSVGKMMYPIDDITEYIKNNSKKSIFVDGYELAGNAGSARAVNSVLLGVAFGTGAISFKKETVITAICNNVKSEYKDLNIKAFEMGVMYNGK